MADNFLFIIRAAILLILGLSAGKGSFAVNMEIYPQEISESFADDSVQISCTTDESDNGADMKEIVLMHITKREGSGSHAIAIFHYSDAQQDVTTNSLRVEGYIGISPVNGYLNVTLLHPTVTSSGQYVCTLFYTNHQGSLKQIALTRNLTVHPMDMRTMKSFVKDLETKTQHLESEIAKMDERVRDRSDDYETLIENEMMEDESAFRVKLSFTGKLEKGINKICGFEKAYIKSDYFNTSDCSYTAPVTGNYQMGGYITQKGTGTIDMFITYGNTSWARLGRTHEDVLFVRGYGLVHFEKGTKVYLGAERTDGEAEIGSYISFSGFLI